MPHTTTLARGTASYRAPELLREDPKYTNKVDIWGLGCILHELLSGKKAFHCEWNVHEYAALKPIIDITVPVPLIIQSHISENIREMLAVQSNDRPRAISASLIYKTYCRFYNEFYNRAVAEEQALVKSSQWRDMLVDIYRSDNQDIPTELYSRAPDDDQILLTYSEWREISEIYPEEEKFQRQIAESIMPSEDRAQAVQLWKELVRRAPDREGFREHLSTACRRAGRLDIEVNAWRTLVMERTDIPAFWDRLENVCDRLGGDDVVALWEGLAEDLSCIPEPLCYLAKWYRKEGDVYAELEVWKNLVYGFPASYAVVSGLADAAAWKLDLGLDEIEVWKDLTDKFPTSQLLLAQLAYACDGLTVDENMSVWKELVLRHGYSDVFRQYLTAACDKNEDNTVAIKVWSELIVKYPHERALWDCLVEACKKGDLEYEISVWKEIQHTFPYNIEPLYHLAKVYRRSGDLYLEREVLPEMIEMNGVGLWQAGMWDVEQFASWAAEEFNEGNITMEIE